MPDFFIVFFDNLHQFFHIILRRYFVFPLMPALQALLYHPPAAAIRARADGTHHAPAAALTVTRIDIDMLGIKTLGTMVGIAIPLHLCPAMLTGEIFNCSGKLGHII